MNYKEIAKIAQVCQTKKRTIRSLYRILDAITMPYVQELVDEEIQRLHGDLETEKRKLIEIIGK
jgi:hypothetical protein